MGKPEVLLTERLMLRRWRPEDEPVMVAINSEPEVLRWLNRPVDDVARQAFFPAIQGHWATHGYGPWAIQRRDDPDGSMIGFAGLAFPPPFLADAPAGPELGWRLGRSAWGHGYATEAAIAARDDAIRQLGREQLYSIVHPENGRSQRVAVKLGMGLDREIDNPVIGRRVQVWTLRAADGAAI